MERLNIDEIIEDYMYDAEQNRVDLDISYAEKNEQVAEWLKELKSYRDTEEQGLLLKLPCPIGTTVYKFEPTANSSKKYIETIIKKYDVYENEIWFCFANGLGRNIKDFGKYVFLTREEAEAKLAELRGVR